MQRIGCYKDSLIDESLNADLSFLLRPKGGCVEDLQHQPRPLRLRKERVLVLTPEEHLHLVQSEGGGVVVRDVVGDSLVHQVGDVEPGEQTRRPDLALSLLGLLQSTISLEIFIN